MLTTIRIGVVSVPLAVLLLLASRTPQAEAADTVGMYLGLGSYDQGTSLVQLSCGWHGTCDGTSEPGYYALDLWGYNGSVYDGQPTYWRMLTYDSGSSTARQDGTVNRWFFSSPSQCDYVMIDMWKLDASWIGRVGHYHAMATTNYTAAFYGKNGLGYKNTKVMGGLVNDANGCYWTGYHVHQDSWLNVPGVVYSYFLGSFPDETTCNATSCSSPRTRNIWSDFQVAFFYYR
jgi:hypothetical protein